MSSLTEVKLDPCDELSHCILCCNSDKLVVDDDTSDRTGLRPKATHTGCCCQSLLLCRCRSLPSSASASTSSFPFNLAWEGVHINRTCEPATCLKSHISCHRSLCPISRPPAHHPCLAHLTDHWVMPLYTYSESRMITNCSHPPALECPQTPCNSARLTLCRSAMGTGAESPALRQGCASTRSRLIACMHASACLHAQAEEQQSQKSVTQLTST